jgi:hypothetical protein
MMGTFYYLIKPNENLIRRLSGFERDAREYWLRPVLWSKDEGPGVRPRLDVQVAKVKLVFLAYLKFDYGALDEFHEIFGELPISLQAFDEWWEVERHDVEHAYKFILTQLDRSLWQQFQTTGISEVDEWIAEQRTVG